MRPQIVCGIDGSRTAAAAAMLAREIARRVELPFEVLHASSAHPEAVLVAFTRALQDGLGQELGADALLRVEIRDPEARVIEASRRARLLVIATRDRGAVRRALRGSVTSTVTRFEDAAFVGVGRPSAISLTTGFRRSPATHLLRRARCPVMVCPSPDAVLASAATPQIPAAPRARAPRGL